MPLWIPHGEQQVRRDADHHDHDHDNNHDHHDYSRADDDHHDDYSCADDNHNDHDYSRADDDHDDGVAVLPVWHVVRAFERPNHHQRGLRRRRAPQTPVPLAHARGR